MTALDGHSTLFSAARFGHPSTTQNRRSQPQSRSEAPDNGRLRDIDISEKHTVTVDIIWRLKCNSKWRFVGFR